MRSYINPFFVCLVNTSVADDVFRTTYMHMKTPAPRLAYVYIKTNTCHTNNIHVYLSILLTFVSQNVRIGFAPHLVQNHTPTIFMVHGQETEIHVVSVRLFSLFLLIFFRFRVLIVLF